MGVLLFRKREQVRECLYFLRGSLFRTLIFGVLVWLIFGAGMMRVEQVTAQERYVEQVFDGRQWTGFVEGIVETAEVNWEKMQGSLLIGACEIGRKEQEEGFVLVSVSMKGKITLDWDESFPKPGDFVRVTGSFSIPEKALNPGEMDYRSYCYVRHIGFLGFGNKGKIQQSVPKEQKEPVRWVQSLPFCARRMAYHVKIWAAEALDACLEEKDAGILKAVLLGDKSSLDMEEKTLYQTSGIAHLLAISGLHISLLGMGVWKGLRKTGCELGVAGAAAGIFVWGYVCMTGMGASAVRAAVMFSLMLGSSILGRTYDIWSALAVAAGLLLWDSPRLLFDAGFQLSFGAVGAIAGLGKTLTSLTSRKMESEKKRLGSGAFVISLAVQWVTIPILCFWYFEFPPYAVLLNLLVIPLMGIVIVSGLSVLGLYGILGWKAAGVMAAGPAHFVLLWYHRICLLFQKLPGNQWVTGRPDWLGIVLYYAMLAAWVWIWEELDEWKRKHEILEEDGHLSEKQMNEKRNEKRNENRCLREKGESGKEAVLTLCRYVCLIAGMGLSIFFLRPPDVSGLEVWFLDVGQGDGILLRTKNQNILIDGGSSSRKNLGEYTLKPCLKSLGITEIDYIFVSHGDSDHMNGILYLLEECGEIDVKYLVLPNGQTDEAYQKLADAMAKKNGYADSTILTSRILAFGAGDMWENGELRLYGMHPSAEKQETDKNNQSIVLLAEYGTKCILFTGDVEKEGEEDILENYGNFLESKDIVLLKAAHHGAKTSTTGAFLEAVKPEAAVLSYGAENSYGHPAKETIERLRAYGIELYETGGHGAVHVKLNVDSTRTRIEIKAND